MFVLHALFVLSLGGDAWHILCCGIFSVRPPIPSLWQLELQACLDAFVVNGHRLVDFHSSSLFIVQIKGVQERTRLCCAPGFTKRGQRRQERLGLCSRGKEEGVRLAEPIMLQLVF